MVKFMVFDQRKQVLFVDIWRWLHILYILIWSKWHFVIALFNTSFSKEKSRVTSHRIIHKFTRNLRFMFGKNFTKSIEIWYFFVIMHNTHNKRQFLCIIYKKKNLFVLILFTDFFSSIFDFSSELIYSCSL